MHMNLVAILDGTKTLDDALDPHWPEKFDFYDVGRRLSGLFDVNFGGNPMLSFRCGLANVSDIVHVDPNNVSAVLTPDGQWHDGWDLATSEPIGRWEAEFRERFLDPYRDCVAVAVDYHV